MDEFYSQLEQGRYFWWRLVPNRNGSTITIPDMSRAFNETDLMEAALNRLRSTPHVLAVDVDDTAGEDWTEHIEDLEDTDQYDLPLDVEDTKHQQQRGQMATLPSFTSPRPSGKRKVVKEKKVRRQRQGKGVLVEPSSPLNLDGYDDGPHEEPPERIGVEHADGETAHLSRYELRGTTYQPHSQTLEGIATGNLRVAEMMTFGNHTFLRYGGWAIQCMTGHCGDALTDSFVDPASLITHCQMEHASLTFIEGFDFYLLYEADTFANVKHILGRRKPQPMAERPTPTRLVLPRDNKDAQMHLPQAILPMWPGLQTIAMWYNEHGSFEVDTYHLMVIDRWCLALVVPVDLGGSTEKRYRCASGRCTGVDIRLKAEWRAHCVSAHDQDLGELFHTDISLESIDYHLIEYGLLGVATTSDNCE